MSESEPGQNTNLSEDQKKRTEDLPNGSNGHPGNADTASGGAPQDSGPNADRQTDSGDVDPDSGTDENGTPVDNPSGG